MNFKCHNYLLNLLLICLNNLHSSFFQLCSPFSRPLPPQRLHHFSPSQSPVQTICVISERNLRDVTDRRTDTACTQSTVSLAHNAQQSDSCLSTKHTFRRQVGRYVLFLLRNCGTKERRSFHARVCYKWHRYRSISVFWPNCWSAVSVLTVYKCSQSVTVGYTTQTKSVNILQTTEGNKQNIRQVVSYPSEQQLRLEFETY